MISENPYWLSGWLVESEAPGLPSGCRAPDRPCQPSESVCLIKFWNVPYYGILDLRIFDCVSMSWCATGPARESQVYPQATRPQMGEKNQHTLSLTPIRPLPCLCFDEVFNRENVLVRVIAVTERKKVTHC